MMRPCRLLDLVHVCRNMRPDEIEQTLAFGYADAYDPDAVAASLFQSPGPKVTLVGADGLPVVCGGVMEVAPGVVSGWMVGTVDGWCANWRSITKGTRRFHDSLFKAGVRRIELVALQSRKDACRWYEKGLKMHREGVRRMYGKNGENAVAYARVNHERR